MNGRAIVVIILCGILIASAVLGALIPFSGLISIDNDKQIKGGASGAEATANINSSTTRKNIR